MCKKYRKIIKNHNKNHNIYGKIRFKHFAPKMDFKLIYNKCSLKKTLKKTKYFITRRRQIKIHYTDLHVFFSYSNLFYS